jgi:hypothetical protein
MKHASKTLAKTLETIVNICNIQINTLSACNMKTLVATKD